ncbi:enoyl-CoA hydratase-related protein [Granulicoccus phenolivorans]|uniref:enoyl-CoA hydratase-related protein n=1 Tax=Granulicoccus phenolivorans TaxID=266854 RepID=UPI00041E82A6|nr:enoyl-CoA hydratase-related protein [Granulicoccus phenolivorans]
MDVTTLSLTTLDLTNEDGLLLLRLNRPDALNSFTVAMAEELTRVFTEVNDDDTVRAVIVTGTGRAFCAGMALDVAGNVFGLDESVQPDWADLADLTDPALARVRDTGGMVTLAIYACRKPVIAAINGAAVGIGATMTLAMDARLVSTKARFGLVFGKLGISPEACSTWFLPRLVGTAKALDLIYSAEILDAEATVAIGLAARAYEPEELLTAARELANRWTRGRSAVSVALMRQQIYRNSGQPHPAAASRSETMAMYATSIGDGKEGVAAFLAKRPAEFAARASQMPAWYADWIAEFDARWGANTPVE